MEDTLRDKKVFGMNKDVLILVLMEDTLRVSSSQVCWKSNSLNPCFNGRYSQSLQEDVASGQEYRLNPCFNGRYSQSSHCVNR